MLVLPLGAYRYAATLGLVVEFAAAGCGRVKSGTLLDAGAGGEGGAAPSGSAYQLDADEGLRLQATSDRYGDAFIIWETTPGMVRSVRFDGTARTWRSLEPLALDEPFLLDDNGSDYPAIVSGHDDGFSVQRYEPGLGGWATSLAIPGAPVGVGVLSYIGVDPDGNVQTTYRDSASTAYWTWWRPGTADWEQQIPIAEQYALQITPFGEFMWGTQLGYTALRFDQPSGTWSEPVDLLDAAADQPPPDLQSLAIGRDGSALAVTLRRGDNELTLEARHYSAQTNAWRATEAVTTLPISAGASPLTGPLTALSDPTQDFIAVAVPEDNGSTTTDTVRYDPADATWVLVRSTTEQITIDEWPIDSAGRVYGFDPVGGLTRYDPTRPGWQDTPVTLGDVKLKAGAHRVFAVGWDSDTRLHALRSVDGAEWEPAEGLPDDAIAEVGSVPFDLVMLGDDRALVVWSGKNGTTRGVFASVLE